MKDQELAIPPTSSDPAVSTIFAIHSKEYGEGILQIALPKNLQGVKFEGNVLQSLEKEIGVGLTPTQFAERTSITITADQSKEILRNMGINLPTKISLNEVSEVLRNTPKLNQGQIDEFYKQAIKLKP